MGAPTILARFAAAPASAAVPTTVAPAPTTTRDVDVPADGISPASPNAIAPFPASLVISPIAPTTPEPTIWPSREASVSDDCGLPIDPNEMLDAAPRTTPNEKSKASLHQSQCPSGSA